MYNPIEINSKFIELVRQNPNLPILAWVNYEVCDDCDHSWLGEIQDVTIEEYTSYEMYNEGADLVTKDNMDDICDYLRDYWYDTEPYKSMSDEDFEKYIENYVNNLEWKKAIFIWVETPDNV